MKNKRNIRTYHLTDAGLVIKGKEKLSFMRRDASHFEAFGITENELNTLAQQIEIFSNWETDIEVKAQQTEITFAKNNKANALLEVIEKVSSIVAQKYKKGSARYKAFGTDNIWLQKEAELGLTAQLVVKVGTQNLAELNAHGLTQDLLDSITALNNEFIELLLNQKLTTADRKSSNSHRITLGNEIYTQLKRYTTLGRSIWKSQSEAKYNDYLIYSEKANKARAKNNL